MPAKKPAKASARSRSQARPAPNAPPGDRAAIHSRTRAARAVEVAEDYVETIADLIACDREARVTDLARMLGVSHVTVVRTVSRLARDGLVETRPYRAIFLTERGGRLAKSVKRRHEVVVAFLRAIGVSEKAAQADAEGIEHHVGEETLRAFERFVNR
jgi:DtxR family manganese transport transcriptional regulator